MRAVEMPSRVRRLPVNEAGYPVPWFVAWPGGRPDFRVVDRAKLAIAIRQRRCFICGGRFGWQEIGAFTLGPMCAVNRTSAEPPSHRSCATYAATVCPFLVNPGKTRRAAHMPEGAEKPGGVMLERNPGVALVWITGSYQVLELGDGLLFRIGEPIQVHWFAQGRAATRGEVLASIETGLPALQEMAAEEGPDALAELDKLTKQALALVPGPTEGSER